MSYNDIDKLRRELAEAERQNAEVDEIKAALPEGLEITDLFHYTQLAGGARLTVTLAPMELSEAITFCERMNPEMILKYKNGWTRFVADAGASEFKAKYPDAKVEGTAGNCCVLKIEGLHGYPTTKTLTFWSVCNGHLIAFNIPIEGDTDHGRSYRVKNYPGGYRIEQESVVNKGGIFQRSVKWVSGSDDQPSAWTLY